MKKSTNVLQLVEMMNEGFVNDGQNTNMYSHIAKYIADNQLTMDIIKQNNIPVSGLLIIVRILYLAIITGRI